MRGEQSLLLNFAIQEVLSIMTAGCAYCRDSDDSIGNMTSS